MHLHSGARGRLDIGECLPTLIDEHNRSCEFNYSLSLELHEIDLLAKASTASGDWEPGFCDGVFFNMVRDDFEVIVMPPLF